MTPRARLFAMALVSLLALGSAACTQGQGEGEVASAQLWAKDCWCSGYNMNPDFFAAVPYRDTLQIRVQRGADVQEISDGIAVSVNDVTSIRPDPATGSPGLLGKRLGVSLPTAIEALTTGKEWSLGEGCEAGAVDPAIEEKIKPFYGAEEGITDTPLVHMALYLQQSCHNQNIVLYAVRGHIVFDRLFSGDPNEAVAEDKLTDAMFDVWVGDPQDRPPGSAPHEMPEDKLTNLKGHFRFYFQRGQPAQPFP